MTRDTIPVRSDEHFDAVRVAEFLRASGLDIGELEVEQFPAGQSNLTYLLRSGTWEGVLAGIDYLDPKVIRALEGYLKGGGVVLETDSGVLIAGAQTVGVDIDTSYLDHLAQLWADKKEDEIRRIDNAAGYLNAAAPLAEALAPLR